MDHTKYGGGADPIYTHAHSGWFANEGGGNCQNWHEWTWTKMDNMVKKSKLHNNIIFY